MSIDKLKALDKLREAEPELEKCTDFPSISPWDTPEKLGVSQGCWEPYGSRQHAEPPVEPTVVDVPPPIRTGEYLPAGFIKMFQKGDAS